MNSEQGLKFPFLKDDTRLIEHENKLYKVRVKYDQESFKGRQMLFTANDLSHEIEQVLRAIIYMIMNGINLQPIETKFFLVLPTETKWSFPAKYPNFAFTRNDRILETSESTIELLVKHVHELKVKDHSNKPCQNKETTEARPLKDQVTRQRRSKLLKRRELEQSTIANQNQIKTIKTQHINSAKEGKCQVQRETIKNNQTTGSRFTRDHNGRLCRNIFQTGQNEQFDTSKQEKSQSADRKSLTVKRKSDIMVEKPTTHIKKLRKSSFVMPSTSSADECTKKQKRKNRRSNIYQSSGENSQLISDSNTPKTCVDCLEEHQFRRQSNRLKSKQPENRSGLITKNDQKITSDEDKSLPYPKQTFSTSHKKIIENNSGDRKGIMSGELLHNKRKRRVSDGNNRHVDSSNSSETNGKLQGNASPTSVYRDILQRRNKDRHALDQIERQEASKLGQLYEVNEPRRSIRQATRSKGRLSGLWNKLWDTIFTPKK